MVSPNLTRPEPSTATDPSHDDSRSPYHYIPTLWVCLLFVTLFAIALVLSTLTAARYRLWWLMPTVVLGCTGEVLGWLGRLWSSRHVDARDPFMIQISCTIIAPTPFLAAIFITFGSLVRRLGERHSWISAALYSRMFLTIDVVSLLIQGIGGAIASGALTDTQAKLGGNIMLAGIVIQLVALLVFVLLAGQFFCTFFVYHYLRDRPFSSSSSTLLQDAYSWNKDFRTLSASLGFITLLLIIRAVYRTVELADGWNGPVISAQRWFNIFDGAMVVLAMYTFLIFHPGRLMYSQRPGADAFTVAFEKAASRSEVNVAGPDGQSSGRAEV